MIQEIGYRLLGVSAKRGIMTKMATKIASNVIIPVKHALVVVHVIHVLIIITKMGTAIHVLLLIITIIAGRVMLRNVWHVRIFLRIICLYVPGLAVRAISIWWEKFVRIAHLPVKLVWILQGVVVAKIMSIWKVEYVNLV